MKKIRQKPQEKERILSQQRDVFKEHFYDLEKVIRDKGIQQRDTWNFDECGFRIGISSSQDVITMEAFKSTKMLLETNGDFISIVKTINAAGETIPPLTILKGAQIMHQHVSRELHLDPQMLLGVSESGYSNNQIALDYIKHFNNHSSHLTHKFITYCFENKIWPYTLPPHSSHVLQPLDVIVFQPYKHFHKKRIEVKVRHGTDDFNKVEFLHYIH
ncbi:hypothetical protein K469DRAFT_723140 [Zopfia rhizophila CBS 207.26]|uniref:DDE-1 domain-containing protein n=1 Tax=Zopfia rhizophila CBS 207.26 TaxID=1314779 RepID=A0A6A6EGW6_9PEZI|nr:hypothetical protein K469DRAFT_723140 [Zopfia rhizophila CBS 207.26]